MFPWSAGKMAVSDAAVRSYWIVQNAQDRGVFAVRYKQTCCDQKQLVRAF